jgi:hypothetical protein
MPQANITYENPYNENLVKHIAEMDEKHWCKAGTAYAPTMFSDRLANFHGAKIGGGSHAGQKFVVSGNSPAYPPLNMNSGMAVNSGGAICGGAMTYAGVDGAVGGKYTFNDFLGDTAGVAKAVAPDLIRAVALGRGRKGGSKIGDSIAKVAKTLAPFAPLLLGLGHPTNVPIKKSHIVEALKHLGAKKSHSLKKLKEVAMSGGYSFNDFLGDVASVGKEVAPDLIRSALGRGKGKRKAPAPSLESMVQEIKGGKKNNTGRKFINTMKTIGRTLAPVAKEVGKVALPIVKEVGKEMLRDGIKSLVSGAGKKPNARALIVKKIMKEKGLKLIEASKYVKAHGLY